MYIIIIYLLGLFISFNTFFASELGTNAPLTSIYGELEVEPRLDLLSLQFQYGIPSFITTSTTLNGGTITTTDSKAIVNTGGTAGAVAGFQTKTSLEYRSGHEASAYFTVAFTGVIAANTKQYIGILDSNNGFGVGFNGITFGVVLRNNGIDTFTPQSSFNGDTLNGSGPSGFTYNPILLNVFRITYGWLGASIIQFQIMNSNGNWITFHTIQQPNSSNIPSIANALLPMSAQVFDQTGGHNLQLQTASWNMNIIGMQSNVANRYFDVNNTATISSSTETHLLTIRNQTTFNGITNKMNIQLQRYYAAITDSSATSIIIINIYKNATVTGTSFSNVNSNSVVAFSSAGTYTVGTGTKVLTQAVESRAWNPEFIDLSNTNIVVYPGETLTLTIIDPFPSDTIIGGMNWAELF